jgi:hypothetical protein
MLLQGSKPHLTNAEIRHGEQGLHQQTEYAAHLHTSDATHALAVLLSLPCLQCLHAAARHLLACLEPGRNVGLKAVRTTVVILSIPHTVFPARPVKATVRLRYAR